MSGILKNQLVKRLACFTKGLSVDKIDIDILSGCGYLDNLELDEQFMSSVMELPQWMCFTKILCSKIRLKVSFTKLKSEPIRIFIDTVYVEAEIGKQCNRTDINVQKKLIEAGLAGSGSTSYGYVEQVIDGMHVTVSTIRLTLSLHHQYLSMELNGVELVSVNRKWKADDLRKTRAYVMPSKEEVLVYKMLTVQHAKFEFLDKATQNERSSAPPLKFNFNMIQLLITMKKLVSTNEVVSACLRLIFDDLLLVFTPTQLQVLLTFSKELSEVIELSVPVKTAVPVPRAQSTAKSFIQRFSKQQEEEDIDDSELEVVSDNVIETSYHLKTGTIDILLCDDEEGTSAGSLQLKLEVVQVELYPNRTGNASRRHWSLPTQYVREAQLFAAEMLSDYAHNTGNGLNTLYEMVVVFRCEHFQILPVIGAEKRQTLGPLVVSDKTKFGLTKSEPALVVTIATYFADKLDAAVAPRNVYVHLNPTEVNFDTTTLWWVREFVAATLTEEFRIFLTEMGKEESESDYHLKSVLVLPHITIPLSMSPDATKFGGIKGIQLWFSKLIITNLNNAMYLPLLSLLHECLTTPLISNENQDFPHNPADKNVFENLANQDHLPEIIAELGRIERLKQELQELRIRQRRHTNLTSSPSPPLSDRYHSNNTSHHGNNSSYHGNHLGAQNNHVPGSFSTDSSPEIPSTPISRRSSSVSLHIPDTLSPSPVLRICQLFPLLNNLVLGINIHSFSADFIYTTDSDSGEVHRSRKFVSDIPLDLWLVEESSENANSDDTKTKSDVIIENGHRKLTRNVLKRQDTLTAPASDYILMAKCSKSVHCLLDKDQYTFLLHLQQEIQEFSYRIVSSVSQIFSSVVMDPPVFKVVGLFDHVVLDLDLPGVDGRCCHVNGGKCCHGDGGKCCHRDGQNDGPCFTRSTSPTDTARTSISRISDSSLGSRVSLDDDLLVVETSRVTSPVEGVMSPEQRVMSPEQRVMSPEQRVMSPEQRVVSPEQRVVSPEQRVVSPQTTNDQIQSVMGPINTLKWMVLSRSDSSIASLSERLSSHSEESLTSITNELSPLATGDSKETLLKFIMRVNKKREKFSVGVQTNDEHGLVAHNYQQLHAVNTLLASRETATRGVTSRGSVTRDGVTSCGMLQVHVADTALFVCSSRDVTTKISCDKVLVLDRDFVSKPRDFPRSLWRGRQENGPEILVRLNIKEIQDHIDIFSMTNIRTSTEEDTHCVRDRSNTAVRVQRDGSRIELLSDGSRDQSHEVHETHDSSVRSSFADSPIPEYLMTCDVAIVGLTTSLRDQTLSELGVFFEPDPTLPVTPVTLNCNITNCGVEISGDPAPPSIDITGVSVKLSSDDVITVGDVHCEELARLRKENEELKEQLKWARSGEYGAEGATQVGP